VIHFIVSFITHYFHSFHSFLSMSLGSSLLASPVWEVWFWKANGIVSRECRDLRFKNLPTRSLYHSSSLLKPLICLLFHSCRQLFSSAAFIAVSVLGGAALIRGRNSRVKECQTDTQKHWNTVMSSCLDREGQCDRPSASLVLSMKRSGVEEVALLGGRGS